MISTAAVCRPMHSNPEIFPKAFNSKAKSFESNPDSDQNVCQASICESLDTSEPKS